MESTTYLLLFALSNLLLFGLIIFFVIRTGRQQRRLHDLSEHLEELVTDLHTIAPQLEKHREDAARSEGTPGPTEKREGAGQE